MNARPLTKMRRTMKRTTGQQNHGREGGTPEELPPHRVGGVGVPMGARYRHSIVASKCAFKRAVPRKEITKIPK
jgi:hypothetical protein